MSYNGLSRMGGADPKTGDRKPTGDVHPDARAGGGGPGYFRDASSFLDEPSAVRQARSPAKRLRVAQAIAPAAAAKAQKPPSTVTLTKSLIAPKNAVIDFDVRVSVLADQHNSRSVPTNMGKTTVSLSGGLKRIPAMSWTTANGKIARITAKLIVRGVYSIRTSYGRGAKPKDVSLYGRGTTKADRASGNVSLGFHEWCHQQEYLNYLTTTPFPVFGGTVGMTEDEFLAAKEAFDSGWASFGDDLDALGDAVDEVGCTKTEHLAGTC
jgi:hypothetical protein